MNEDRLKSDPMRYFIKIVVLCFLFTVGGTFTSCSKYAQQKRAEKQRRNDLAKEQERRDLEAQQAYEEALERHYAMQTKETRKSMRKNMKKMVALKENKKTNFLQRWFTPKRKKRPPRREG
jgi:hypothetical protein